MKAVILAAGHGTRLRPLTDKVPKCLLPIRGVPLLQIWLELCQRHGIDEVLINTHANAEAVSEFAGRYDGRVLVRLVNEPTLLGSAGTIRANRDWLEGEDSFWILYGDVLTTANLGRMLAFHVVQTAATLGLYRVANPRQCGIVSMDQNSVIRGFQEKPFEPASDLAFSGVMIGTSELLDYIPRIKVCDLGFDVFPRLVNRMRGYHIPEYVKDIGTVAAYERAQVEWGFQQASTRELDDAAVPLC